MGRNGGVFLYNLNTAGVLLAVGPETWGSGLAFTYVCEVWRVAEAPAGFLQDPGPRAWEG